VRETYEQLNGDAECLRLLDEGQARFSSADRSEARHILGAHGTTVAERCAGANGTALADWLAERLDAWQARDGRVAQRVAERINDLLDLLETTT
jgi:hypothetical protein